MILRQIVSDKKLKLWTNGSRCDCEPLSASKCCSTSSANNLSHTSENIFQNRTTASGSPSWNSRKAVSPHAAGKTQAEWRNPGRSTQDGRWVRFFRDIKFLEFAFPLILLLMLLKISESLDPRGLSALPKCKSEIEDLLTLLLFISKAFEEWGDWPEDEEWKDDKETPVGKRILKIFSKLIFEYKKGQRHTYTKDVFSNLWVFKSIYIYFRWLGLNQF